MFITAAILRTKGACKNQLNKFANMYPDGVEITEAGCVAVADQFNWGWAARNLLSRAAQAEYERVTAATFGRLA